MQVILYEMKSSLNSINKVLENPLNLTLNMRGDLDLINPSIKLSKSNLLGYNFNYIYFVDLQRYYFIDSKDNVNNKIVELILSIDVLETFKTDILASNARLKRSIKNGDYYDGNIDKSVKTNILNYNSDKTLEPVANYVLTTVGA